MATRRRTRNLIRRHKQRKQRKRRITKLSFAALIGLICGTLLLEAFQVASGYLEPVATFDHASISQAVVSSTVTDGLKTLQAANGRPQLDPLPQQTEVWECEVVVVGGSLGGVAAASHAMKTGAQTCLIELTPWLGGQVSSQGVSAIDESRAMRSLQNFSSSWQDFKQLIRRQPLNLPEWTQMSDRQQVFETNSCWVGDLCFMPKAGAKASQQWLESAAASAPGSRWATSTAFKGATFDPSGRNITTVYAVQRTPKDPQYVPAGRLSQEISSWYAWSSNEVFTKTPIRLQAPPGKRLIVIDATDTGEFVGWAQLPYRVGSDAQSLLGEANAPLKGNPDCTQAFTFPFVMAIAPDDGQHRAKFQQLETGLPQAEHRRAFDMEGFPMFHNRGMFNYRRIVSRATGPSAVSQSTPGEITLINWNRGNDWSVMDDPLIMNAKALERSGQHQNWIGGLSLQALRNGENNAFLFADWLMETQATSNLPLTFLAGTESPLGTASGLSMMPYIREGRRIIGRPAYGQETFMLREADLRTDMEGGRDFDDTAIALSHYDIDIHGCRYRNWQPSFEATGAGVNERLVRPLQIPLAALIPIGVDNLLIGGKSIAASHIVNAMTRVHQSEWGIGAAAGATAGWLVEQGQPVDLTPAQILVTNQTVDLQNYLIQQGLRFDW